MTENDSPCAHDRAAHLGCWDCARAPAGSIRDAIARYARRNPAPAQAQALTPGGLGDTGRPIGSD